MTPDTGPMHWFDWLPPEGFKILLVLFLSFLVGLEPLQCPRFQLDDRRRPLRSLTSRGVLEAA